MSPFALPLDIYHVSLIFLRVGAVVMLLPAVGDAAVPMMVRLSFALLLSLCMVAVATPHLPPMPATVGEMGGQLVKELFIGLGLGQISMGALADRFGLSLGFHACSQDDYLAIIAGYAEHHALPFDPADALEWSKRRGARSGRVAWHYVTELAGRAGRTL